MTTTYCTSDELSRRLASDGVAISADYDDELTDAITVASRAIDAYTNRRFYADTTTSAREFDYSRIHKDRQGRQVLEVDDLQAASITEVVADDGDTGTYGTTWSTSDYYTYPLNGLNERGEAWRAPANSDKSFVCNHVELFLVFALYISLSSKTEIVFKDRIAQSVANNPTCRGNVLDQANQARVKPFIVGMPGQEAA